MSFQGHVQNGVVVFDEPVTLPEGTAVRVEALGASMGDARQPPADGQIPPLAERLRNVIGKAVGLPEDAARHHDHYLYGVPKKP